MKNKNAQKLGSLGGQSTAKKYGSKHFSEAGKKGMAKRWGNKLLIKTKPNNSDWDFNGDFEDIQLGITKSEDIKNRRFITNWLNRKRLELLTKFETQKKQFIKQEREKTLKEVEGIIGLDEFRVGQVYFFKKQLLSKIKELK